MNTDDAADYSAFAERLETISADLDEAMFDRLREAAADGKTRPADDKRLLQARRAIDKAAHLLRGTDSS